MSGIEILNESTLNLADLRDRLELVKKRDTEIHENIRLHKEIFEGR